MQKTAHRYRQTERAAGDTGNIMGRAVSLVGLSSCPYLVCRIELLAAMDRQGLARRNDAVGQGRVQTPAHWLDHRKATPRSMPQRGPGCREIQRKSKWVFRRWSSNFQPRTTNRRS